MQTLSSQTIVHLWESGLRQRPLERMVTLLSAALPGVPREDLLVLSIGQCDAYLLLLYEQMFGSRFVAFTECGECQERLEFTIDLANIWAGAAPVTDVGKVYPYQLESYELQVRLPTLADLLAISASQDVYTARQLLLQRCVVSAAREQDTLPVEALADTVTTALGEQLLERDRQAEVQIDIACPQCEHHWPALFDVSKFLWAEIQTHAKMLLREVHSLARAYGWREADILALSPARRQFYLEMVNA